jgi:transcriptional regulator with XRE-family HTH domain
MSKEQPTPGGQALRRLRQRARKTQDEVECETGIGKGKLSRIERGKAKKLQRDTLERILTSLGARYNEQRKVLELYGHNDTIPQPTDTERSWARKVCEDDLHSLLFPAYLLDCTQCLLDWNHFIPKIIGKTPDEMERFRRFSLNYLLFDEQYNVTQLVADPDSLFPNILRALQGTIQPYQHEAWCREMIDSALKDLPLFKHYWEQLGPQDPPKVVLRPELPISLHVAQVGRLDFRVSSDHLIPDERFRVVYYMPANAETMHQCARWSEERCGKGQSSGHGSQ